jgi:hypothetical protein
MHHVRLVVLALGALGLTACDNVASGDLLSAPGEPSIEWDVPFPDVDTDWPFDTDMDTDTDT